MNYISSFFSFQSSKRPRRPGPRHPSWETMEIAIPRASGNMCSPRGDTWGFACFLNSPRWNAWGNACFGSERRWKSISRPLSRARSGSAPPGSPQGIPLGEARSGMTSPQGECMRTPRGKASKSVTNMDFPRGNAWGMAGSQTSTAPSPKRQDGIKHML